MIDDKVVEAALDASDEYVDGSCHRAGRPSSWRIHKNDGSDNELLWPIVAEFTSREERDDALMNMKMRAALAAADKVRAEGFESGELPDDLREPLHSLRADLDWLVARIHTEDDEVASLCKDSIRTRLSHIEEASYRLAAGLAKGEADRTALVEALDAAQGAVNAAVERTQAEYAGHDKRAERFDRIIREWRVKRDAALALVRKGV